jgi:hypothetical protein
MSNFYDIMKTTSRYLQQESASPEFPQLETLRTKQVAIVHNVQLPPTPGFEKLGPAAREAARSRAKNFYPFD